MNEDPRSYCERYQPDYASGLSEEQVAARVSQGLTNASEDVKTKSVPEIIRDNLVTPFNILNVILAALILAVGSLKNLLFMGVIISNTLIGIIQEIKAKKTIDRLSLITAPKTRVVRGGKEAEIAVSDLVLDDVMLLSAGKQVCADCILLEGECEADESLITGESDPIAKKPGDGLRSGSFLVSGTCRARVEHIGAENYAAKITASAKYIKKPNSEILKWVNRIIKVIGFSIIPIGILLFYKQYFVVRQPFSAAVVSTVAALIGMIPEGLVLLTSVVLAVSVIRLSRRNALVQELYSIETLARVDVLCLDKTGTLTQGSLQADDIIPLCEEPAEEIKKMLAAFASALDDHTPTMEAVRKLLPEPPDWKCSGTIAFSSARKWSGASFEGNGSYLLGAGEFILGKRFGEIRGQAEAYSRRGQRVLLFARSEQPLENSGAPADARPLALILLSDRLRENAPETLEFFAKEGVMLKVISGDNPLTVSRIAQKAGLAGADRLIDAAALKTDDDIRNAAERYTVFGRVTPRQKLALVRALKEKGHTVAMTGDGVNDVPALRESDCSIAMASGSDAACTVSQLVLLDSNFTSMPRIVAEGRRSINNLQRSASLFMVKAGFSAIIAVLFLFLRRAYPFQPIQFTLINAVMIGFPSFFLAMEPNRERLRGSFMVNVMEQSVPGALTMAANLAVLALLAGSFGFSGREFSTLCVLLTGCTGLMVLFRVCYPFNLGHRVLFLSMAFAFILALILFPGLFEIVPVTPAMAFVLAPMLLFAVGLMAAALRLVRRLSQK